MKLRFRMCLKVTDFCFSLQYSLPAFQRPNLCLVSFLEIGPCFRCENDLLFFLLPCSRNDVHNSVWREMLILQFILRIIRSGDLAGLCWKQDLRPMQSSLSTSLLNLTVMSPVHLRHLSDHVNESL